MTCTLCNQTKDPLDMWSGKRCRSCETARRRAYGRVYDQKYNKTRGKRPSDKIAARVAKKRQYIIDYLKGHPCIDCGETDPIVLEFDHRNQVDKKDMISKMARKCLSIQRIDAEIAKCDVRCANCHRRRTAIQLGWYKGNTL